MRLVLNKCYGGFGLSRKAIMRYAEIKGIKLYPWISSITKSVYKEKAVLDNPEISLNYCTKSLIKEATEKEDAEYEEGSFFSEYDIARTDPALIQTIEELGSEEASGKCAQLAIIEIPDDIDYLIDEYDGIEHIAENHRTWY